MLYFLRSNTYYIFFSDYRVKVTGFPLRLENLEKWESIFQSGKSQGILNRLEKLEKMTQNTGKFSKFQKKYYLLFLVIFK